MTLLSLPIQRRRGGRPLLIANPSSQMILKLFE